jgi:RNA polymerase sigma-70 factor, ECF subfamily
VLAMAQAVRPAASALKTRRAVDGFDACYAAGYRRLTSQIYAYCGDLGEAQEVVQEAFCRALMRWDKLEKYDDPVAWIRRVAWNLATSRWRRRPVAARYARLERPLPVAEPSPDRVALVAAPKAIPASQRRVVVMSLFSVDVVGYQPG